MRVMFTLEDNPQGASKIPLGTIIPAQGFLFVWADSELKQNSPTNDLHVNFKLAAGGDEIGLFAADAAAIDTVRFGVQTNNLSQGRYPDGSATILFLPVPTPRLPLPALP